VKTGRNALSEFDSQVAPFTSPLKHAIVDKMELHNPKYHWVKYLTEINIERDDIISYSVIARALIFDQATRNYQTTYGSKCGKWKISRDGIEAKLKELGGFCFTKNKKGDFSCWAWENSAVTIYCPKKNVDVNFNWITGDTKLVEAFLALEQEIEPAPAPEGQVYVLVPSSCGITRTSIGLGSCPLNRENYRPEVIKDYDKIVEDLKSKDPLGRLVIFSGPTGTGKTYLVRALLDSLPDVVFLLLPSNMTSSMSGPEILSALISASEDNKCDCSECSEDEDDSDCLLTPATIKAASSLSHHSKKRTIALVVEDADNCLASRVSENVSAISAVLNLSDGIIGNCLDLRIICTTNQDIREIDAALLRRGRLSKHVEVNELDVSQAKEIYKKVGGTLEQKWDKKFYALSDVYAMAKNREPIELEPSKPTIGFQK
jgi:ATPase family associated with various cellular activities (AAA)